MNTIEVNGQEVEKYEYLITDDGEPRINFDIQGEAVWTGKTKALVVIMPHYDNDKPTVINVGLDYEGIEKALDIADGVYHDLETWRKEAERLQREVDRLQIKIDRLEEEQYEK